MKSTWVRSKIMFVAVYRKAFQTTQQQSGHPPLSYSSSLLFKKDDLWQRQGYAAILRLKRSLWQSIPTQNMTYENVLPKRTQSIVLNNTVVLHGFYCPSKSSGGCSTMQLLHPTWPETMTGKTKRSDWLTSVWHTYKATDSYMYTKQCCTDNRSGIYTV